MRSSLTSRPSAPRWGWEVHFQIFVLTLHIVQVVGVCTDSHVTVRTMLMNSAELKVLHSCRGLGWGINCVTILTVFLLKGIKFPIICDRDGDFSRAFGVLKVNGEDFGAARAVFETLAVLQIFLFFIFFTAVGCARP